MTAQQPPQHEPIAMGIMSGTSCDGLDMVLCRLPEGGGYEILSFESVPWPSDFRQKLEGVIHLGGRDLAHLENEFTARTAEAVKHFVEASGCAPGYIGAHGHTVFHEPLNGLTTQMLNGGMLAVLTGVPVVCDFRRQDVALSGQGAPLVPIGDRLLFSDYDACVNIGGVANVSFNRHATAHGYDICPANMALNELAARIGLPYDENGDMARQGEVDPALRKALMEKAYFLKKPPKTLGREWYETEYLPLLHAHPNVKDALATVTEVVAVHIAEALRPLPDDSLVLLTGGGAFNGRLVESIRALTSSSIVVPDPLLIEAKEALIFALLAKLRLDQLPNVLPEVTGAKRAVRAGAVYLP